MISERGTSTAAIVGCPENIEIREFPEFPGILVANVLDLVTVLVVTMSHTGGKLREPQGGAANGYRSDFMAQMKHINSM